MAVKYRPSSFCTYGWDNTSPKNIMVVGTSGLVGRRSILCLLRNRHIIYGIDEFPSLLIAKNYHHTILELMDDNTDLKLRKIFQRTSIDLVIFLSNIIRSNKIYTESHKISMMNSNFMEVLLNVMNDYNVKDIIHGSSYEVYNSMSNRSPKNDNSPSKIIPQISFDETDELRPTTFHGKLKLKEEELIKKYVDNKGFKAIIFRVSDIIGGSDPDGINYGLIPDIIRSLYFDTSITIHGKNYPTNDGTYCRDYVHVIDFVNVIHSVIIRWDYVKKLANINTNLSKKIFPLDNECNENSKPMFIYNRCSQDLSDPGWIRIYNIGMEQNYSVLQIFRKVCICYSSQNEHKKFTRLGSINFAEELSDEPATLMINCQRARRDLAFHSSKNIDSIIRDSVLSMVKLLKY